MGWPGQLHALNESQLPHRVRPYLNHAVSFKRPCSPQERIAALESVGLNVFFYPAELVSGCDLLSDSGTTAMTSAQWAALHLGDEAYGSNRGYFVVQAQVRETFGEEFFDQKPGQPANAFLFHQGRAAEDALFAQLGASSPGLIVPSNGHFDTTQANLEAHRIQPLNLFSPQLKEASSACHFKGDMDVHKLENLLEKHHPKIPLVYLTITNNTGGGQPVSMDNVSRVGALAHQFEIPLFLDACRFAENAYFIQRHEPGFAKRAIPEIVREMFSHADGFTISFKKDGLANMGGGLFVRRDGLFARKYPKLLDALTDYQIRKEGHPTYGGMSGRDILALAQGLKTVTEEPYLSYRVEQVASFGYAMAAQGLPVLTPFGGHAVYLDMNRFFADSPLQPADFGGVSFVALLLGAFGHRACELGHFAFGKYDTHAGKDVFPEVNFVRFAVPRLRYEQQDLQAVAEAAGALYQQRDRIPPVEVVWGRELPLRHFKARFRFRT